MTTLTHRHSPLEQTRKAQRLTLKGTKSQLNPADQADLKTILEAEKLDYVDSDIFQKRNAQKIVFDDAPPIPLPDTSWYHPVMDSLSAMRQAKNVKSVLLTAAEERALFIQYNYCRFMVATLRDNLGNRAPSAKAAREILTWHRKAEAFREQIAQTNLALVLAMAKRTRMSEIDFGDLVSEGNMALLRAVDKFDAGRGFKFSTYACRAILKAFSRAGIKFSKYRQMFPTDFDPKYEKSDFSDRKHRAHEEDCADEIRLIFEDNRAELSDIEQEVIEHRFALGKPEAEQSPLTLEQVGKLIGVTKERVRQIQNKALDKIRTTLEDEYLS